MGATCNIVACDCNGGPNGIVCGGNSYQQQHRGADHISNYDTGASGGWSAAGGGAGCRGNAGGNTIPYTIGGVGSSYGAGGGYYPGDSHGGWSGGGGILETPATVWADSYHEQLKKIYLQTSNVNWTVPADLTISNSTTITIGNSNIGTLSMSCNSKVTKYVNRYKLTVVDVSKGARPNTRLVLEKDVFDESNDTNKIMVKYGIDINSALATYNVANKLEVTIDDLSITLNSNGQFILKDE